MAELGYTVEWNVVKSGQYGFDQRRKRVYIFAEMTSDNWDLATRASDGVMARAFPIENPESVAEFEIQHDPYDITQHFDLSGKKSPFCTAGVMQDFKVLTFDLVEKYEGELGALGNVLVQEDEVPDQFFISDEKLEAWKYLKGGKREERVNKKTGFKYVYSEGSMSFPDSLDKPSRTILTGEGGIGASRFKHVVEVNGRLRRLVPDELDRLQGFPKGWTNTDMSDGRRAFCMGNALVVGVPHRIGVEIARDAGLK